MAVTSLWVGGVTTSSVTVAAKLTSGTNAALRVSTASNLSGGVTGSSVAISASIAKVSISGLTAGTQYYYGIVVDGVLDTTKTGSFRTAPSGAANFSFAFGSCALTGDSLNSFTRARARNPDLCIINGDLHYEDPGSSAEFHTGFDTQLAGTFGTMAANVPIVYTWSDHDWSSDNNGGASSGMNSTANSIYRARVPSHPLVAATTGIYHTFTYGRVRFIVADERSFKSSNSATDNSSKTMLGSVQKQWLKDTITAATEPVIFWVGDAPWNGPASTPDDEWFAYNTERQELATFFAASGKNIIRLGGDMHAMAADSGANSPGGIPILQAAPWGNTFSNKGGPYSSGPYPTSGTSIVRQYGIVTVTDSGSSITVDFGGYDTSDVKRVSFNRTYTADVAPPEVPVGDLPPDALSANGWTQYLAEDFDTNCAEGSFISTYPGWFAYPADWTNSPATSWYNGGNSVRVENGVAKIRYFTDGLSRRRTEALEPPGTGDRSYGVYEICYRIPAAIPGYKQAFLLWPESDEWGDGEVDYPEANFKTGNTIGGFVHERGSTPENNAYSFDSTSPVVSNAWNIARIVWADNRLDFYLDGVLIGSYSSSTHVPDGPHRWVLQTEAEASGLPSSSVTGFLEIAYVAAWEPAPRTRVVSDWSDAVSATTTVDTTREGDATGSTTWSGVATGARDSAGAVVSTVTWSGLATGAKPGGGEATGAVSWNGSATGAALDGTLQDGTALGAVAWVGVATGITVRLGEVLSSVTWAGAAAGGATPDPIFRFSPPSHEEPIRTTTAPLHYYRLTYANSLLKINGAFVAVRTPAPELLVGLTEGVDFFRGGYEYDVSQPVAAELEAAGYSVTSL